MEVVNFIEEACGSCSQSTNPEATGSTSSNQIGSTSPINLSQTYQQKPQVEELDEVQIQPNFSDHTVYVGARLEAHWRNKLIEFLSECHDCFAWTHTDMTDIDPSIVTHQLNVDPNHIPVKQ